MECDVKARALEPEAGCIVQFETAESAGRQRIRGRSCRNAYISKKMNISSF